MNYSFEGCITEKEYKTAVRQVFFNTPRSIIIKLICWISIIILLRVWYKETDPLYIAIMSSFIMLIILASEWVYGPFKLGREFKKSERLRAPKKWILSDAGCEIGTDFMNIRYEWHEFSRVRKKGGLILLQMKNAPSMYQIIPVRLLGTQADAIIADIEHKLEKSTAS